ncbi:hypothetical protein BH10BAC3_BH10BAC3_04090 [soil metagenome]
MKNHFLLIASIAITLTISAQKVGIGTTAPNASAMLDVNSTTKGVLLPRMTTAQRNAITSPALGLLVFDTDKGTLYLYDGDQWLPMLVATNTLTGIAANNSVAGDFFGNSVAISGNYAVIGAPAKTVGGHIYQGSAYIFFKNGNTWLQQQELLQGDGAEGDFFGSAVAINGTTTVIGAYNKTENGYAGHGAAYVFNLVGSTWTMQKKLLSPGLQQDENFGKAVSAVGNKVLVGAPKKNTAGDIIGGAYIFTNNAGTWSSHDLVPNNSIGLSNFGYTVSISANLAVVGAGGRSSVFVYFLSNNSWTFLIEIKPADVTQNDAFGSSVAAGEDYIVVGAPNKTIGTNANQGAVYVLTPTSPVAYLQQKLTASDGAADDHLGISVATQTNYIVAGASGRTIKNKLNQGAAYVFFNNAGVWKQQQKIISGDGTADNYFGASTGVSGSFVIIGASGKDSNKGGVYFVGL